MMEKEQRMNEISSHSEKKAKKKNLIENFDVPNFKKKDTHSIKINGNHNFSFLSNSLE